MSPGDEVPEGGESDRENYDGGFEFAQVRAGAPNEIDANPVE